LNVLHGEVSNEDYWRAYQEVRDLFASAITSKGTDRTRRPRIKKSAVIDPGLPAKPAPSTHPDDPAPSAASPVVAAQGDDVVPGTTRTGRTRSRTGSRARANAPVSGKLNGARSTTEATTPTGADQSTTSAQDKEDGQSIGDAPALPDAIEIHPFAKQLPEMSPQEFESLKSSIAASGLREPIVVHERQIVDGRNRDRACRELGITPSYQQWDGRGSLVTYIIDKNITRRHLSESQRALLAVSLKTAFEEEAKANMRRGGQGLSDLTILHSRDRAAEAVRVSSTLVGSAEKVIDRGAPELVAAVKRGEVKISAAAAVVELDAETQTELVARGRTAIHETAKQLRAAKAKQSARRAKDDGAARPGAAASATNSDADTARLLPPAGWLEAIPLRSRLAKRKLFDYLATVWWIAQALLPRFHLSRPAVNRVARPLYGMFDANLLDLVIRTASPEGWTLCDDCVGSGRYDDDICPDCRGLGFHAVQSEPEVPGKRRTTSTARRPARKPAGTATGTDNRRDAKSKTKPRHAGSRGSSGVR
jgi:ParB-like chromosome segregation protein Spo0J